MVRLRLSEAKVRTRAAVEFFDMSGWRVARLRLTIWQTKCCPVLRPSDDRFQFSP